MHLYQYPELCGEGQMARLLTLYPSRSNEPVCIGLRMVRLDGHPTPDYEALSYTWGSTADKTSVIVGQLGIEQLMVTQSLYDALLHLRLSTSARVLWIDSICIDQSNVKERGVQVAQMGNIFHGARRVLIWLGPEENDSSYAFDLIESLGSKIISFDINALKVVLKDSNESPRAPEGRRETLAMEKFFNRPWFERLWVRQEVLLAKDALVMCGSRTLAWPVFKNVIGAIRYADAFSPVLEDPRAWFDRLRLIWELCRMPHIYIDELRTRLTKVECSDPRDRIYGLLPLLTGAREVGIVPNYAISTAQVYEDVAIRYMTTFQTPHVLLQCELSRGSSIPNLPSWVPDWSTEKASKRGRFGPTKASSNLAGTIESHEPGKLRLGGVRAGRVSAAKPAHTFGDKPLRVGTDSAIIEIEQCIRELWNMIHQVLLPNHPRVSIAKLLDALCDSLGVGYFEGSQVPLELHLPNFKKCREALEERLMDPGTNVSDFAPGTHLSSHWTNLLTDFRWQCGGTFFFVTENGHIGLGPVFMQPGDEVAVFLGSISTMIIRPTADKNVYQIVGEAYIPGLNGGEAIFGCPEGCDYRLVDKYDEKSKGFLTWYYDNVTDEVLLEDPKISSFPIDVSHCRKGWANEEDCVVRISVEELQQMGIEAEYLTLI